jgi:pimeloyl-ACP methyl ester carboxylesterase
MLQSRLFLLAAAVLMLAALVLVSCQSGDQPNPAGVESGQVNSFDGVTITYDAAGTGDTALVFVHGWALNRSYWKDQMDEFDDSYRVVAIDLGGHGGSGLNRTEWTTEAFAADVAAVCDQLGLQNIVLVGHSMGGAINIEAARLLSGRVLLLVGADTYQSFGPPPAPDRLEQFLQPLRENFAQRAAAFVNSMIPPTASDSLRQRIMADAAAADPQMAIPAIENVINYDPRPALAELNLPIWCVNTTNYPTDTLNNRQFVASFEVKYMTGVGHYLFIEDPVNFNNLLHETLIEFFAGRATGEATE